MLFVLQILMVWALLSLPVAFFVGKVMAGAEQRDRALRTHPSATTA
jgi:hypothetical protein